MNSRINDAAPAFDGSVTVRSLMGTSGIAGFLAMPGVTEVAIGRPFEVWTESRDGWVRHDAPACSLDMLMKLANALSIFNKAVPPLSVAAPIKPVRLPDGERGQIVIPPACEPGTVSLTIRIPSNVRFTVAELIKAGFLSDYMDVSPAGDVPEGVELAPFELGMLKAKRERDIGTFLELAIGNKLNVLLVGGTGSGKTTLSKALADLVPADVRVATIEDTHEMPLPYHPNHVHLFYSDSLPARDIVKATLRMKFDRVYLAELRGDETWDYLALLNTGHSGGLSTVHANDCLAALSRVATLIKQSPVGQTLEYNYLLREVKTTIDVVLFMERKRLTQVYYNPVEKWKLQRGLA
ncbi:type IV secretion system protein VirB11 [Paraburkholderia sp. GAS33]|uniref:P-type DNA transfer ATPase VirB11 n=1 Tax=Paraburkholderia sp. GAS33 TaxID=3035130 RepID=UPI003D1A18E6